MRSKKPASCAGLSAMLLAAAVTMVAPMSAIGQEPSVSGTFTANGDDVELSYVYVYEKGEGFYDSADPAWEIIFAAQEIGERELDEFFHDFPYVKISITLTDEFGDEPKLEVYSHNVKLSAEGANISGGDFPELNLSSTGPEAFAGRIHMPEPHEFFDDTYQYDFTFTATLSDPNAPIGEVLPADGGEPGRAYVAWIEAVRALDVEALKTMVPAELAEMLEAEGAAENLEMMREMAPESVRVLGGSSDGSTAILEVIGVVEGEEFPGEIELSKEGDFWIPVSENWG